MPRLLPYLCLRLSLPVIFCSDGRSSSVLSDKTLTKINKVMEMSQLTLTGFFRRHAKAPRNEKMRWIVETCPRPDIFPCTWITWVKWHGCYIIIVHRLIVSLEAGLNRKIGFVWPFQQRWSSARIALRWGPDVELGFYPRPPLSPPSITHPILHAGSGGPSCSQTLLVSSETGS